MPDIVERIGKLRQTATRVQQMRADANTAISFARQQLTQIDDEFRKHGVDPDNCEAEVSAMEAQLEQTTTDLEAQLAAEEAELTKILDLARQAQLIR